MTSDENHLREMLGRYTNPNATDPDNVALQEFVKTLKSNTALVSKAHDLIVEKIRSPNVTEAGRAVLLLDECMSNAGPEFQRKTAKFEFLNKLIVLVQESKAGVEENRLHVEHETKQRIMECLMLWTVIHADKPKINQVFDSLKKQVDFEYGPLNSKQFAKNSSKAMTTMGATAAAQQHSNILGKDNDLVAKLLKEGGEENYKKANLVIQRSVMQDARRTELICFLKNQIKSIEDTMEVLSEMLNTYCKETPGNDSSETMKLLYHTCLKKNEEMARWPDILDYADSTLLDEILTTKDILMVTLQRYKEIFETDTTERVGSAAAVAKVRNTTTAVTSRKSAGTVTNTDLLSDLLRDVDLSMSSNVTVTKANIESNSEGGLLDDEEYLNLEKTKKKDTASPIDADIMGGDVERGFGFQSSETIKPTIIDELSDIFGTIEMKTSKYDVLKPISVFETDENLTKLDQKDVLPSLVTSKPSPPITAGFRQLREIDKLSEEIFKQNLKTEARQATFKKEPEKVTLNDLANDKVKSSLKTNNNNKNKSNTNTAKLVMEGDEQQETPKEQLRKTSESLELNNVSESLNEELTKPIETMKPNEIITTMEKKIEEVLEEPKLPFKHLAEIFIDLYEVTPLADGERLIFEDDDIKVSLKFTTDRPSAHVSVIVMSVKNKSKLPVKEFQFEASVKKPCKVRLLPPTDTEMAPEMPFRPSTPIHQVILLLNPTKKSVDLTCVVGYKMGDDPDPIKEPIVAKEIPFV